MNKSNKKALCYIACWIIFLIVFYYGKGHVKGYDELRARMYNDFENFGTELEILNDHLSQTLVLNQHDFNKEKKFVNRNVMLNFWRSDNDAADLGKGKMFNHYTDMYLEVNDVIYNIVADEIITTAERKYLESLYTYNNELLKEYNHVVGDIRTNWDYDKIRKSEKKIVKTYNDFSQKAENLLETPKYSFLKEYKGDFKEADCESAKSYCEEVFSKLVKDQTLKYNNKDEVNTEEYVFETSLKTGLPTTLKELQSDDVEYKVSYDKETKKVVVRAVSYSTTPSIRKYTEDELDKMANDVISKFYKNASKYDKNIDYEKGRKIDYIKYYYMEKTNGIYDETKKIEMNIEAHGLVSNLEIMHPNEQEIIMPTISKEEIVAKIDKDAEIIDCIVVRNIEGKTDYVVHLRYKDTLFEAVFDGETGNPEYYGREIKKNYYSND
ncbi:hypothetical protein IZY60_11135 [Lutibacter sp. B2]|nr:hypothetical protein [Lutibacter sp. B2]